MHDDALIFLPPLAPHRPAPTPLPGPLCELHLAPDAIHPGADRIENDTYSWAHQAGLADDRLIRQRVPRLAARTFPDVPREKVAAFARWHVILFALDDRYDNHAADPAQILHLYEQISAGIENTASPCDDPVVRAIVHEWRVISEPMSPAWRQRFLRNLRYHGQALAWEALRRGRQVPPTLSGYNDLRPWSNGMFLWDLLETVHDVEIPSTFADSLAWKFLIHSSNDVIAWRNDIASAERESASNSTENSLIIHARTAGLAFEQAQPAVEEKITARTADFLLYEDVLYELAAALPDRPRAAISTMTRSVRLGVAGYTRWLLETSRYQRPEGTGSRPVC